MLTLSADAAETIARHAEATYPDECVGLLLGGLDGDVKTVVRALAVENRWAGQVSLADTDNAESRRDRFYLDPRDYLRADREARAAGMDIVGCYHSHPDDPATPSERDRVGAQGVGGGTGFAFVIQSVRDGRAAEVASWLLVAEGARFEQEELALV
ncbi:M67 family metallopeptidase [Oscillochloris sp. ZM17-4]|uniref:M67 family metallopeptidase n=1 Tax=Oscillochloris sp. ZM17-4 TaxID=2866714 RepID=UPI001C72C62C|nr:M67 family metallopeptidase [Oscillochloris sp. ZM17-4]MBX0328494.1 M67 family metallopeptidase [Oscillochloris sp. ZM17-4]